MSKKCQDGTREFTQDFISGELSAGDPDVVFLENWWDAEFLLRAAQENTAVAGISAEVSRET